MIKTPRRSTARILTLLLGASSGLISPAVLAQQAIPSTSLTAQSSGFTAVTVRGRSSTSTPTNAAANGQGRSPRTSTTSNTTANGRGAGNAFGTSTMP